MNLEHNCEAPSTRVHTTSMELVPVMNRSTGFAVFGKPPAQPITKWVVPFCTSPKEHLDCSVRVYCISATRAALEEVTVDEKALNGTIGDARKQVDIINNEEDICVTVENVREGWKVDEHRQIIPFKDVWCASGTFFPNVTFTFERVNKEVLAFSCTIRIKQDSGWPVKLKITRSISDVGSSLAKPSGITSLFEAMGANYIIPMEKRWHLCSMLDKEEPFYRDYRILAEDLGYEKIYIDLVVSRQRSPTDMLIEDWEKHLTETIPLEKLIKILIAMGRADAAEILKMGK